MTYNMKNMNTGHACDIFGFNAAHEHYFHIVLKIIREYPILNNIKLLGGNQSNDYNLFTFFNIFKIILFSQYLLIIIIHYIRTDI